MKKVLLSLFVMCVVPSITYAAPAPFVGSPKTRAEMLRCETVVSKYSKRVYQKGNKIILTMAPRWAFCPSPKPPVIVPLPVVTKSPAQLQLEFESRNLELYGDARGPQIKNQVSVIPVLPPKPIETPTPSFVAISPVVIVPTPTISESVIAPTPDVVVTGSSTTEQPVQGPHFVGVPYSVPSHSPATAGYAIKFSEPTTVPDPHQDIYRFFCTSEWDPNGINYSTQIGEDFTLSNTDPLTRSSYAVGNSGSPTPMTCKFRFNLPTGVIESEEVKFVL